MLDVRECVEPNPRAVTALKPSASQQPFSLVAGGLLFQTFRRAHLSGDAPKFVRRRVLGTMLLTWVPLLLMTGIDGHLLGSGAIRVSFIEDVEAQVRFLIGLPLLLIAEVIVDVRVSPLVQYFLDRRIISPPDIPAFNAAVRSAIRARDAVILELAVLAVAYTGGLWLWRRGLALDAATWYARPVGGTLELTRAGFWYALVSIPFFQFVLLRWYLRMILWFRLLWRISRLRLHLTAVHPDRAGGIGFLGGSAYAFSPLLVAQGALLSGLIASRVLFEGQNLMNFKMDVAGLICLLVLFVLGPLVIFAPQLDRARREGMADYGLLASQCAFAFEQKWIHVPDRGGHSNILLGSQDLQGLAATAHSFAMTTQMRRVPFDPKDIARLAAATAAPLLPLALTMFSLQELLVRLQKIVL